LESDEKETKVNRAATFIRETLEGEPKRTMLRKDLAKIGGANGFHMATLKRAMTLAGARSYKIDYSGLSYWTLNEKSPENAIKELEDDNGLCY